MWVYELLVLIVCVLVNSVEILVLWILLLLYVLGLGFVWFCLFWLLTCIDSYGLVIV